MKLPAVAIAVCFASGIAIGFRRHLPDQGLSIRFLAIATSAILAFVLVAALFAIHQKLWRAAACALLSWFILGVLAVRIDQQPRSANHALRLVDNAEIDLKSPLRFYGRLRDEPEKLPWGIGYEIELEGVEAEGRLRPASGGLRVSYPVLPELPLPPELHAGDSVSVLAQARLPQTFRDEGAFDRREYLSTEGVDLQAALRAPQLLNLIRTGPHNISSRLARLRHRLREKIDELWQSQPQIAGVMRAMLLGDRNFIDRNEAVDFQKTGAFHVLVLAGLHVGAVAMMLFWLGRKARLPQLSTILLTLAILAAYVSVVEQRTPVLRAVVMAAIVIVGGVFFRRLELLNSAAIALLILLVARPATLHDSSFQLSFLAIGCIAGLALPWLERTVQGFARALHGWRDVTRDGSHEPRAAQFRIDLRSITRAIEARLPARMSARVVNFGVRSLALTFRAWELLVLTLVLQLGMLPLFAQEFHRITLAAAFVNFAAVPLTAIIVPCGFVILGVAFIFPWPGIVLAEILSWIVLFLVHTAHFFAELPRWSYRIPGPPVWLAIAFFALLIVLVIAFRITRLQHKLFIRVAAVAAIAVAITIAASPFAPRYAAGKLEVDVLDVGQGDAIFIVSPHGKTMLVDGGGAFGGFPGHPQAQGVDPGEEAVSPFLWSRNFKKIDIVALTHAHQDHLGGLNAILQNFSVGKLWVGREVATVAMSSLENLARARGIPVEHEERGSTFLLDGLEGRFLWPQNSSAQSASAGRNEDSLVLRLRYGDKIVLLPGDAEKKAEAAMLTENDAKDLAADVLKIGHHGSKNSTTQAFLDTVKPKFAVISAGEDNPYGHPNPELLQRLLASGTRIFRTDRDGAIHITTDGHDLEISCFVPCGERKPAALLSGNLKISD